MTNDLAHAQSHDDEPARVAGMMFAVVHVLVFALTMPMFNRMRGVFPIRLRAPRSARMGAVLAMLAQLLIIGLDFHPRAPGMCYLLATLMPPVLVMLLLLVPLRSVRVWLMFRRNRLKIPKKVLQQGVAQRKQGLQHLQSLPPFTNEDRIMAVLQTMFALLLAWGLASASTSDPTGNNAANSSHNDALIEDHEWQCIGISMEAASTISSVYSMLVPFGVLAWYRVRRSRTMYRSYSLHHEVFACLFTAAVIPIMMMGSSIATHEIGRLLARIVLASALIGAHYLLIVHPLRLARSAVEAAKASARTESDLDKQRRPSAMPARLSTLGEEENCGRTSLHITMDNVDLEQGEGPVNERRRSSALPQSWQAALMRRTGPRPMIVSAHDLITVDDVLNDRVALDYFAAFLYTELSLENVMFLYDVRLLVQRAEKREAFVRQANALTAGASTNSLSGIRSQAQNSQAGSVTQSLGSFTSVQSEESTKQGDNADAADHLAPLGGGGGGGDTAPAKRTRARGQDPNRLRKDSMANVIRTELHLDPAMAAAASSRRRSSIISTSSAMARISAAKSRIEDDKSAHLAAPTIVGKSTEERRRHNLGVDWDSQRRQDSNEERHRHSLLARLLNRSDKTEALRENRQVTRWSIVNRYIGHTKELAVNIEASTVREILDNVDNPSVSDATLFVDAVSQVYAMLRGPLGRFQSHPLFRLFMEDSPRVAYVDNSGTTPKVMKLSDEFLAQFREPPKRRIRWLPQINGPAQGEDPNLGRSSQTTLANAHDFFTT